MHRSTGNETHTEASTRLYSRRGGCLMHMPVCGSKHAKYSFANTAKAKIGREDSRRPYKRGGTAGETKDAKGKSRRP